MEISEYLQDPCGMLSIPYCKAGSFTVPDCVKIIHSRDWDGQFDDYKRYFRVKHDLKNLKMPDFDFDTISIEFQAKQL